MSAILQQPVRLGNVLIADKVFGTTSGQRQNGYFTFLTVQGAVDAAASGDVVMVGPQTFSETVTLKNGVALQGINRHRSRITNVVDGGFEATCDISNLRINGSLAITGGGTVISRRIACLGTASSGASAGMEFHECELTDLQSDSPSLLVRNCRITGAVALNTLGGGGGGYGFEHSTALGSFTTNGAQPICYFVHFAIDPDTPANIVGGLNWMPSYVVMNSPVDLKRFTVATAPSVTPAGKLAHFTDESTGSQPAYSDGAHWKRFQDGGNIS